jgi:type VI secretion system protein ImpI
MNDSMELILTIVDLNSVGRKIDRSHRFNKGAERLEVWMLAKPGTGRYRIAVRRSSIHARIIWQDGQFCLEDVSGTTFVNEAGHSIGAQM